MDIPAALYYRELLAAFPEAKVILTVRDPGSWYESMRQTIYPATTRFPNRVVAPFLPFIGAPVRVVRGTQLERDLIDRFPDREHAIETFDEWNEEVKRLVPADRLLVFEVRQGWEPLCEFLGVPVPDVSFPRANDAATFRKRVLAGTVVSWLVLLLPISLALGLLTWLL